MPGGINTRIGEFKDGDSMNVPGWKVHVAWWALDGPLPSILLSTYQSYESHIGHSY
jgi:hypothetical protein